MADPSWRPRPGFAGLRRQLTYSPSGQYGSRPPSCWLPTIVSRGSTTRLWRRRDHLRRLFYVPHGSQRRRGTLEKRFSRRKTDKVYAIFSHWGFAAVAIPALLPPPFPIVPMLLAAGAMQYPTRKFLTALAVGRGIRFTILGYLGAHYGRHIMNFFSRYYWHVLLVLIAFSVLGGTVRAVCSTHAGGKPARLKLSTRNRSLVGGRRRRTERWDSRPWLSGGAAPSLFGAQRLTNETPGRAALAWTAEGGCPYAASQQLK